MFNHTLSGQEQTSAPTNSATELSPFNLPESSPKRLNDKHYRHCCGSDISRKERGLNPDWVQANCYSVTEKEATALLGYTAKSEGIMIKGANGQYQFRPERPWSDKQGKKAPKYRTATADEYDAFLPTHPTDQYYWLNLEALKQRCWHIDGHPYLLITEGIFKAICACSHDIPTIALLGVEMGLTPAKSDPQGKRYLVSALEIFAQAGFGFILAFDTDISSKEEVKLAVYKLGCQLKKFNTPVSVLPTWDEQLGKGIDDYIQMNNIDKFREILAKSISFETWVENQQQNGEKPKLSPLQQAWRVVNKEYAHRLRFNELTLSVELDGEAADLDGFYLDLELIHNCSISKDKAYDLAVRCAKQNPYHPVKDYLNNVANTVLPIDIRNLSQRYFGTLDPIYNEMMYRHLIGSVARVFEPGCKKDESVILKGKQGLLKSTFWKVLYGDNFFSDSLKGTDRDDLLVLHQYWALELAEFETIASKKQAGELKAFLSAGVDTFREPYGRHSKPRKRQSVIVGSVNPDSFLVDETGNRRYWVIPVNVGRIDISTVAQERDGIWAAAVAAYRRGEYWYLSYEDERKISELNTDYCHADSWEIPISNYILDREMVTTFEVLTNALDFDKARICKRDEMRVANILRSLGWKKTNFDLSGQASKGLA
jgi:predicted P-loop ATPase